MKKSFMEVCKAHEFSKEEIQDLKQVVRLRIVSPLGPQMIYRTLLYSNGDLFIHFYRRYYLVRELLDYGFDISFSEVNL